MAKQCPKCGSTKIRYEDHLGFRMIICKQCKFDERSEYDETTGRRSSARQKSSYTPYKTGGSKRSN
ncbi:MAG: hypothetical protein QF632_06045 [Candidatus Woesearchaeota archaeon]|jgi:hypothetical protein|nr:hypothetical protein [Candidatus Woesearchaeota archaeon]MDP7324294.1 hypothetical protein [Candidatus Woesearchaeota archaeon]MDP7457271.1 hypothetical protein [Candidatus Woesearchaeota archaeon]